LFSGDVFGLGGSEHRCAAVSSSSVLGLVAPGEHDLAGLGFGGEPTPVQVEDLRCRYRAGLVEAGRHQTKPPETPGRLAWAHGGPTNAANTVPLCCRHDHTKHGTDWTIHPDPDGSYTWTSPTGRHHRVDPTTHPVDHTLDGNVTTQDLPRAG
jgi:hypothetical protein